MNTLPNRIIVLLMAIYATGIVKAESQYQFGPYKLNGEFGDFQDVTSYEISPDGTTVVYIADQDSDNDFELYSVPITGGDTTKLNGALIAAGQVLNFKISADSSRVIYSSNQDTVSKIELYSIPIGGGVLPIKINDSFIAEGDIVDYFISADSSRVIYLADQITDEQIELFSVPIAGGTKTHLNDTPIADGDVKQALISDDSASVVFRVDRFLDEIFEIYSVPIDGGTKTKLNGTLVLAGTTFSDFKTSSDSTYVVYRAQQDSTDIEIYSTPIAGGSSTKLNSLLVDDGDVFSFIISPDGSHIAYFADQILNGTKELFLTPINTENSQRINGSLTVNGDVADEYLFSPDSNYIVYRATQRTRIREDLYSVKLFPTISPSVRISDAEFPISKNKTFINKSSEKIVYAHQHNGAGGDSFWSAPIDGGFNVRLDKKNTKDFAFRLTPDGSRFLFVADDLGEGRDFFINNLDGTGYDNLKIQFNSVTNSIKLDSQGKYIVYLSYNSLLGKFELFAIENYGKFEDICMPLKTTTGSIAIQCW